MLKGIQQYSQSQCDWQWDGPDPNKIQLKKTTTTEWKCGGRGGDSPSWNTFLSCSDMSPVCCCQWTVAQSQVLSWQLEIIMEIILQIRTLSVCECFCPPPDNSWTLAGVSECRQCSSRRLWVRVGFFSVYILSFPLKQVSEPELNSPGCDLRP